MGVVFGVGTCLDFVVDIEIPNEYSMVMVHAPGCRARTWGVR